MILVILNHNLNQINIIIVEGGEEDQDTEGDDMNDAEEIEADVDADSLEETEFVEGMHDKTSSWILKLVKGWLYWCLHSAAEPWFLAF